MKKQNASYKVLADMREAILRICMDESKTMREIMDAMTYYSDRYGTSEVKSLVYSMARSLLLVNQGKHYITTKDGKKHLKVEPKVI